MSKRNKIKNKPPLKNTTAQAGSPATRPIQTPGKKLPDKKNFFSANWRQISIISLLAFGLYAQSVNFDYVLDDTILIVNNKFTQQGIKGIADIFSFDSFRGYFGPEQKYLVEGGRYRPFSIATFALEQSITGGNKAISHAINVLLYILTGILLYSVLLFMFPKARSSIEKKWFFTVPFVATILFIAHPLHTEIVANIKGRDEMIAMLGEMGSLYFTFKYLQKRSAKFLFFSFLSFFAGILSKEGVITFLAVIPLTVHFFTSAKLNDKIKIMLPLVAGTMLYLMMRYYALGYLLNNTEISNLMNNPFYGMNFGEKTATIFYTLLVYLKLHIVPYPLTIDYYPYQIPIMKWSDWQSILSLIIHLGFLVLIWKGWKKKTVWVYAILFYLITLSIVSNLFVSVGTFMNERFVYHASLGFCIAAAWLMAEKMSRTSVFRNIGLGIFILTTIALSALTLIRVPDWRNQTALDKATIKASPNSARANFYYGMVIWNDVYKKLPATTDPARRKAVLDSINPWFQRSLQILPSYSEANAMKAGLAGEYHKLDNNNDALLKSFEEVILAGTYEKFILEYLQYVNKRITSRKEAEKFVAFYGRMITYYDKNFKNTSLPSDYRALLKEIQERMLTMQ